MKPFKNMAEAERILGSRNVGYLVDFSDLDRGVRRCESVFDGRSGYTRIISEDAWWVTGR